MKINKRQLLGVDHARKGYFIARAIKDFDTDESEFYPLVLVTMIVEGIISYWREGEKILCRGSFCKLVLLDDE